MKGDRTGHQGRPQVDPPCRLKKRARRRMTKRAMIYHQVLACSRCAGTAGTAHVLLGAGLAVHFFRFFRQLIFHFSGQVMFFFICHGYGLSVIFFHYRLFPKRGLSKRDSWDRGSVARLFGLICQEAELVLQLAGRQVHPGVMAGPADGGQDQERCQEGPQAPGHHVLHGVDQAGIGPVADQAEGLPLEGGHVRLPALHVHAQEAVRGKLKDLPDGPAGQGEDKGKKEEDPGIDLTDQVRLPDHGDQEAEAGQGKEGPGSKVQHGVPPEEALVEIAKVAQEHGQEDKKDEGQLEAGWHHHDVPVSKIVGHIGQKKGDEGREAGQDPSGSSRLSPESHPKTTCQGGG